MLAIAFTFPGGRYHATPWDRHVNEGAVAWPPEPWRLLRGLIAIWHHKIKPLQTHDEATLHALVESLSRELPHYRLPPASHSHTRHYMPQFKSGKSSLVFDAFTAVARDEPLVVVWQTLALPVEQTALLDDLLSAMGYLGRAESWVEARRLETATKVNCYPGSDTLDRDTGEIHGESVTLLAPVPYAEYSALRNNFLADARRRRKLAATLPDTLLDALSVETGVLRKQGWNQPPAARKVSYIRPLDALRPVRTAHTPSLPRATTYRFIMIGKPLPRVEDSVRVGELLRRALMGEAGKQLGRDAIPASFSGHGLPAGNRHRHAFFLPWDADDDGRIDRVLLHVPDGVSPKHGRIIETLRRLWSNGGDEWRLVLENSGGVSIGGPLTMTGTEWQSVTPYLHPWHVKKRFGIEDQIRRECRERGLPEPVAMDRIEAVRVGSQWRRPVRFYRFRSKSGLNQPDKRGSFWRLAFPEPVRGPLALGFGCHFGLGMFRCLSSGG